jgi:hypothetical protein
LQRNGAVLKVELDDDAQVEGVRNAFTAAGAVDIDECIESWRVQGSAVGDAFAMKPSPMAKDLAEDVIPVLQEELSVGKRYAEPRPAQMPVAALGSAVRARGRPPAPLLIRAALRAGPAILS